MLKTKDKFVVDDTGNNIFIRGTSLGSWLMMERHLTGFAGVEQQFRNFFKQYAGAEKADYFFDGYLSNWVGEADFKYIKELGCNSLRIAFNYRHFESDIKPFEYKPEGFRHIDRLLELAKKYQICLILDMHAAPGFQNHDWHSDNYTGEKNLYADANYQKRLFKLWRHIADHYKNEEYIAGYEVFNEPVAEGKEEEAALNKIYKETVKAIREVDKSHIVFLEGNFWGRDFECLDAPFDSNLVYSPHFYSTSGTGAVSYPGPIPGGEYCNKRYLEAQFDSRDWFMNKYNVPCWLGEFGWFSMDRDPYIEGRQRYSQDLLDIINARDYHWSHWIYKDAGNKSLVYLHPESPWMTFNAEFRDLKTKYKCDVSDVSVLDNGDEMIVQSLLNPELAAYISDIKKSMYLMGRRKASEIVMEKMARKFAKLSYKEIDDLLSSFKFENCLKCNAGITEIFRAHVK
jgi:hypothetical protein